jgi:hypothetical protein
VAYQCHASNIKKALVAAGGKIVCIMNTLESKCKKLLIILENGDVEAYKRLRTSIVADISDNDFMVGEYEDDLAVGKALVIILDDISHGGILYKRIVLIAMRSLLKIIITYITISQTTKIVIIF